jgi:hypothetical protein
MPLVVEDGSGLTNADAYVSVGETDTYNTNFVANSTWQEAGTDEKELAIRKATAYLDNKYRSRWRGRRSNETQALSWPRAYVVDDDGFGLASDDIPTALKNATAEAAIRALTGELMSDLTTPGTIGRTRKKVGPLETETEFVGGSSQVPSYRVIDALLRSLITPSQVDRG